MPPKKMTLQLRTHTKALSVVGIRYKVYFNLICGYPFHNIPSHSNLNCTSKQYTNERRTPCIPISHVSSQLSVFGMRTQITTFDEDYQQPAPTERRRTVTADPRVVICIRLGYQQLIHTPQQYKHTSQKDSVWFHRAYAPSLRPAPSPTTYT